MTSDFQLVENEYGDTIQILILDKDGNPDDLTVYNTIKLVVSTIDFSTNIFTLNITDPEINADLFAEGIVQWIPSANNPAPDHGDYWMQIFRGSLSQNKPVRKFYLQTTRAVPQS